MSFKTVANTPTDQQKDSKVIASLYNGQVEIYRYHPYKLIDHEENLTITPPGVTTITGQFSKEAIPQWAANEAAKTAIELTKLGKPESEVYDRARKRYIELRDEAADGGTEGHKWIETYVQGQVLGEQQTEYSFESEHGIQFVEAYLQFERDHDLLAQESETMLYSRYYRYAGIRDNLCMLDGVLTTLDYKTGNPDFEYNSYRKHYSGGVRAYDAHFMQCAGYDIAETEEHELRASQQYALLYLIKDPEVLSKKYDFEVKPYYLFTSTNTTYWAERFINARDAWYLANQGENKYVKI